MFIFWLLIFLFIIPPLFIMDASWIGVLIPFSGAIVMLWIWFNTGYTIEESVIKINYGPIKKSIDIHEINSIRSARNPFIDPALSMDKIEINYAAFKTIAISPKNQEEFVHQLLRKNPHIRIERNNR
ncbi:hypothetical protein QY96_01349 [Bacillus thermotolerans]|uniref:Uncharacterized protein YyaB-like PH domain-containing protein n=2 Tax=Bacillus thermotolerans TaxID=1221996 RepID=A0A0F5HRR3_BACTR|nr:hypothetical protein QY95_03375 [Bacillus thermotolerans]KKB42707.1 hypothetical protein QY96_01349 [Bacillus thermotolerans]